MSIKLQLPKLTELKPRITVVGVGGAGGNALNNMIASGLEGVEFVAANTDAQALAMSSAEHRIQLGVNLTEGLGAGSKPEIGEAAAEEALEEIRQQLSGSHMCFIAAGMGGGTGTGAAAVLARIAKELGVLTVGVVTKPFLFEGARRMRMAEGGIAELKKYVDTLIVIPNQNLFRVANERTTFAQAFHLADQVLHSGIACIVDLIVREGLINLDFADVRTVMSDMGTAVMGTGQATGERRAIEAAEQAIHNPLLDEVSLKGARGLLLSITGSRDLTLYEVDEAASRVRQEVDAEANIIVGATFDDTLEESVRVSIVAAGIEIAGQAQLRRTAAQQAVAMAPRVPVEPESKLARRLSEAMRRETDAADSPKPFVTPAMFEARAAQEQMPPLELEAEHEIGPERARWVTPDDVTIIDELPQMARAALDGHAGPAGHRPGVFTPAAPADPGSAARRMPQVQDFPAVGQREYRAKAQQPVHAAETGYRQPPAVLTSKQTDPVEQRRPGFLARLTGGRHRKASDLAAANADSRETAQQSHTQRDYQAPQLGPYEPQAAGPARTASSHDPHRPIRQPLPPSPQHKDAKDVELPMFFQKTPK
jgi:cell division protein FtsZ